VHLILSFSTLGTLEITLVFRSSKEELGDERRAPKGCDFMDISNT
jgi:hypothetical protein